MNNKTYKLCYLESFEQDLIEITEYIAFSLKNPEAASRLIDHVEAVILKRQSNPIGFEPFPSKKKRKHPYYRIYVNNYTVYYVVIGNVMEVRRLLYSGRDVNNIL